MGSQKKFRLDHEITHEKMESIFSVSQDLEQVKKLETIKIEY